MSGDRPPRAAKRSPAARRGSDARKRATPASGTRPAPAPEGSLRASQLGALSDALDAVLPFAEPADSVLHQFFRRHPKMGQHDRAFVAEGVFAVLRRLRSLSALAQDAAPRRLAIAAALREMGLSLRELEPALSAEERNWATELRGRKPVAIGRGNSGAARLAVGAPRRGVCAPKSATLLARAWLSPALLDLRVNPMKTRARTRRRRLRWRGSKRCRRPILRWVCASRVAPRCSSSRCSSPATIEVQDEGSQLLGFLVAPRRTDMVVDFCAGAGGKTLLLGALMRSQGRVYAFDVSPARLAKLKPRLARSGLSNVQPVLIQNERDTHVKRLAGKIDRVLVDAPCSGLRHAAAQSRPQVAPARGRHRRARGQAGAHPRLGGDIAQAGRAAGLRDVQRASRGERSDRRGVPACASAVRPGERRGGTRASRHSRSTPAQLLKLYPHRHGCDGFFAAILERQ